MKETKRNVKIMFLTLLVTLAIISFYLPTKLAYTSANAIPYIDFSYMTIGTEDEHVSTTVYTGATYTIANGYIGGNTSFRIGDIASDTALGTVGDGDSQQTARLVRSDITVTYGSSSGTSDVSPSTIAVAPISGGVGGYGTFVASKQGTYTITYSYEYTIGDGDDAKTYYNYYDMTVTSSLSEVNIDLEENNAVGFFPSIIDLSQFDSAVFDNDGNVTSIGDVDFTLPLPTITDENGEEIEDFEVIIDSSAVRAPADENEETNQLLVTVVGVPGARSLNEDGYISMNAGKVMLDGSVFTAPNYDSEYSDYTIRYSFYHNGQFVTSFEKESTTVYKSYYENYSQSNLEIATDSTLTTSAQPGVEQQLPGVIVTTNSRVNPSNSEVDVRYSVQVLYKCTAGGPYQPLNTELYNAEEEIIGTDGNLIDPTVFTPLEEGYYTFIYTAEDIYGNIVSTTAGQYEWRNIRDTQAPTALVYDASVVDSNNIATVIDNYPPQFRSIDINNETLQEVYEQYADIELPTIIVTDDLVNYMNYKINVYHISKDGARTKISSPLNSSSSFSVSDFSYTVYGGTFTAPFAGDYSVATEIRDSANNTIVVFSHYSVAKKMIVQEPVVNSTLESQTVELDDNPVIEIPVPTVEYSIDNSLDYESYFAGNYDIEPDYVVLGVDADGNATDYTVSNNLQNSYIPTREDVGRMIDIYYNVTLRVYAPSEFTYHEGTYEEFLNDNEFGTKYFTLKDGDATIKIKTVDENSYKIKFTNNNIYEVSRDAEGVVTVTLRTGTDETPYNTIDTDIGITDLFANLITFNLTSDIYYITVQDTIGPVIRNYNYVNAISADQLSGEGYTLNIQGIEATDASGINLDRSSVSVTTTYKSEGQTHTSYDSLEADELLYGKEKTITRSGTITISYTVYDNNGNSTTKDYVIKAGDVVSPTLTFDDDFLKDSYKYDESLIINLATIHYSDDTTLSENIRLDISLVKDSAKDTKIAYTIVDGNYHFPKFDEIGSYTLTISVTDSVGNFTTKIFNVNVEKANYDMSDIKFEDAEFVYDGTEKTITISGELPDDVKVSYSQNILKNAGELIVVATFSGDYSKYNEITSMTAKLTIKKAIPQCTLSSIIYIRTGQRLSDITLPSGWTWEDDSQIFNTAGDFKATAIYTPDDTDNFEIVTLDVTISVEDYIPIYIICGIIGGVIGIAIVGITGLVLYLIFKRKR